MDFPEINTERLRLGKIEPQYIPQIVQYANNKVISDNLLSFSHPYFEKDAQAWIEMSNTGFEAKTNYIFAIYRHMAEFIGGIGLHLDKAHNKAEIGYWIGEPFWNQGFASEAGKAVIEFGFKELSINKIFAVHFLFNPASEKVLKKIGMRKEAKLKHHYLKNGNYEDVNQYAVFKKD